MLQKAYSKVETKRTERNYQFTISTQANLLHAKNAPSSSFFVAKVLPKRKICTNFVPIFYL